MDHIVLLICLFPVVFMLHDFEEIIMQQRWMERNAAYMSMQFFPGIIFCGWLCSLHLAYICSCM